MGDEVHLWRVDDPARTDEDYFEFVRNHISDHRLLWAELRLQ